MHTQTHVHTKADVAQWSRTWNTKIKHRRKQCTAVLSGSVTMAWHVLRLRMEEQPPVWTVAVNIVNKQLQTADKGWSSSWVVW